MSQVKIIVSSFGECSDTGHAYKVGMVPGSVPEALRTAVSASKACRNNLRSTYERKSL